MKELQLWNQLKAGDKSALEKIYRLQVQLLYRYGCRFTSDHQLVEDCIQDLFIELWNNHQRLGDTTSIERYLLASIRRKIIRGLQKQQKINFSETEKDYPFSAEVSFEQTIIGLEINEEQAAAIQAAFQNLSKRQKEAIYLKYYAGLDYEEIEQVMNINYQSARNLVSGGLKKMKGTVSNFVFVYFLTFIFEILST